MDMDISMDIHAKFVDMDGKFHIHGNSGYFTQDSSFPECSIVLFCEILVTLYTQRP